MWSRIDDRERCLADFSWDYEQARLAFNKKQYARAIQYYEASIRHLENIEPDDAVYCSYAETYMNICDAWLHLNQANKANHAIKCFYQAVAQIQDLSPYASSNNPQTVFDAFQRRVSNQFYIDSHTFQVQHEVLAAYADDIEMKDMSDRLENIAMDFPDQTEKPSLPSLEMSSGDWTRLSFFYTKSVEKRANNLSHDVLLKLYENILTMLDHIENKTPQDYRLISQVHANLGNLYHQQHLYPLSISSYQAARQALLSIWWREDGDNTQITLLERHIVCAQNQNAPSTNYSVEDDLASLMHNLTIEQHNRRGGINENTNLDSIINALGNLQVGSQSAARHSPRSTM